MLEASGTSAARILPQGWQCFTLTRAGCSCSFFSVEVDPIVDRAKQRSKLEKKGWSNAKLERAMRSYDEKRAHEQSLSARSENPLALQAVLSTLVVQAGEAAFHAHWYDDSVVDADLPETPRKIVSLADLSSTQLPADAVVMILAKG